MFTRVGTAAERKKRKMLHTCLRSYGVYRRIGCYTIRGLMVITIVIPVIPKEPKNVANPLWFLAFHQRRNIINNIVKLSTCKIGRIF